jgi:hypothetical protein
MTLSFPDAPIGASEGARSANPESPPVISRFPDVQLHIWGLRPVAHPGMTEDEINPPLTIIAAV